jgi:hypothetical protein
MMNYVLYKVAPGSYDLELDGELIGGVVRTVTRETAWTAELLDPLPAEKRPSPSRNWSTSLQPLRPFSNGWEGRRCM